MDEMGNVIAFPIDGATPQKLRDEALVQATRELLHTNAQLAMAIKDVMDRLLRLQAEADTVASGSPRRMIDMVIEQDQTRLISSMGDVLDSINEYASGMNTRMQDALKDA